MEISSKYLLPVIESQRLSRDDIDSLKERVPLNELIERDEPLMKSGSSWIGRKHNSLVVKKDVWFWNSKGTYGDHFDWLIDRHSMTFTEAVDYLKGSSGIRVSNWPRTTTAIDPPKPVVDLNMRTDVYRRNMNDASIAWWKSRGLDEMDMENWRLGYCENHWNLGESYAIPIVFNKCVSNIRHRIAHPVDHQGKYKPESVGLGIQIINGDAIEDEVIVVEGEIKTMVLCHFGLPAIGLMGCQSFKSEWMSRFKSVKTIYIVLDPGINPCMLPWCNRLARYHNVRIVRMLEKPDDFIISDANNVNRFCDMLRDATPLKPPPLVHPENEPWVS